MRQRKWFGPMITATGALIAGMFASGAYAGESRVAAPTSAVGTSGAKTNRNDSRPHAVAEASTSNTAVDPRIVTSDNAFGLDLFKTLSQGTTGNIAISPISVALALQMVYNGAAGTTQQSMAKTLRLGGLTTRDLNNANAALQASLSDANTDTELTIANSLWMHVHNNPVLSSFTRTLETYYGDTVGDLAGAPKNVNAWVANETKGLIKQILPPEPPSYYAKLTAIIANAIYFKGRWSIAFDARSTGPAPFTLSDGAQTSSEMMHQTGEYQYLQGSNFQVLRVPYGRGRRSMLIVLPNPGVSLRSFVAGVTPDDLNSWITQLHMSYGKIALPRFTSKYGASLPSALTSLGMGNAFCSGHSVDFTGIGSGYCLSDVEHKAVVKVDEIGTVAAAATSVEVHATMVRAFQFTMTMDHPFLYAIRDDMTRELLFIAALENPN